MSTVWKALAVGDTTSVQTAKKKLEWLDYHILYRHSWSLAANFSGLWWSLVPSSSAIIALWFITKYLPNSGCVQTAGRSLRWNIHTFICKWSDRTILYFFLFSFEASCSTKSNPSTGQLWLMGPTLGGRAVINTAVCTGCQNVVTHTCCSHHASRVDMALTLFGGSPMLQNIHYNPFSEIQTEYKSLSWFKSTLRQLCTFLLKDSP